MAKKRKDEVREAQAVAVVSPIAMTLAKKPANRTGFKVVRSDETEQETETMTATHHERKRTKKKTAKRDESLYMIRLPDGISREEATIYIEAFAMTEDYEIFEADDGSYWLRRKSVTNWDDIMAESYAIDMGDGFVAHIDQGAFERNDKAKDGFHGVSLVELEFDGYTLEDTKAWLDEKRCDFKEGGIEVVDGGVIVARRDHNKADTRKVRIGEGVTGVVVRADENDVPVHLYRAVIEESYGYYGYGMLDFAQYLASPYYADATWDGIYALREVLENVTLYSGLPLDERKALVDNALDQFGTYYKALIDAMPRETVQAAQRFDKQKVEAEIMAKKETDDKVETRTDEQIAADQATAAATAETAETRTDKPAADAATETADAKVETGEETRTDEGGDDAPTYVTKDELPGLIAEGVTAALKARDDATAAEAGKTDEPTKKEEARTDAEPSDTDKQLAEGVTTLADATAKLMERMDKLDDKLDQYGETVEARSEVDGGGSAPEGGQADKDVFDGMMGALNGLRQSD